jgi:hypothetical protein
MDPTIKRTVVILVIVVVALILVRAFVPAIPLGGR